MDQLDRLETELKNYQLKLSQLQHDWSISKEGSRYGNEYLETQIKVYQDMILQLKNEIFKLKK